MTTRKRRAHQCTIPRSLEFITDARTRVYQLLCSDFCIECNKNNDDRRRQNGNTERGRFVCIGWYLLCELIIFSLLNNPTVIDKNKFSAIVHQLPHDKRWNRRQNSANQLNEFDFTINHLRDVKHGKCRARVRPR